MGKNKNPIVVITTDVLTAVNLVNELQYYVRNSEINKIRYFPDWETLPYDIFSPYQDIISERLKILFELTNLSERHRLVVPITSINATLNTNKTSIF